MKKNSLSLRKILAFTLILVFTGCGDDDNNDTDIIIGRWLYIGDYDAFTNQFEAEDDDCYTEYSTFNKNGTGSILFDDCLEGDTTTTFNWKKESEPEMYTVGSDDDGSNLLRIRFEGRNKMFVGYEDDNSAEVYQRNF